MDWITEGVLKQIHKDLDDQNSDINKYEWLRDFFIRYYNNKMRINNLNYEYTNIK